MKKTKFIFDVDGTLTPSRQTINSSFAEWFLDFCNTNDVYLVTGSDYDKTLEQLGVDICNSCCKVFSCSGNDIWEKGINTSFTAWQPTEELINYLTTCLEESAFTCKTGNHFEIRKGCLNFSIVGRNADKFQRADYINWDMNTDERIKIANELNYVFSTITATVGGETGIDICLKGRDKSQILKHFSIHDKLYFFGDKTTPGGNDYTLAKKLKNVFTVTNWGQTWEILLYLQESGIAQ